MLVRDRQLELEKSCGTCLEEGQAGNNTATSQAVALRRVVWREKEDMPLRVRKLEKEEERERGKGEVDTERVGKRQQCNK